MVGARPGRAAGPSCSALAGCCQEPALHRVFESTFLSRRRLIYNFAARSLVVVVTAVLRGLAMTVVLPELAVL